MSKKNWRKDDISGSVHPKNLTLNNFNASSPLIWINFYFQLKSMYIKPVIRQFFFFCCGVATQRRSWPHHSWGFLDHTQRRTTVSRTPLDEWSACRRNLYLTTHNTHNRQTSKPPGGIRTHVLSRRAAADLRLRPRGHRDRPSTPGTDYKYR